MNPYLAGGLFVDYLLRSRYRLVPKGVPVLAPCHLSQLTVAPDAPQNAASAGAQAPRIIPVEAGYESTVLITDNPGLEEMKATHE